MINYRTQSRFREINRFSITGRNVSYFVLEEVMADRKEYKHQWYLDHKESVIEKTEQWRLNHPKYHKQWYSDHKEERIEYGKQWRINHLKSWKKYLKQYRQTPEGKISRQREKTKRRAQEREILNTLTAQEWVDILKEYKFRCAYCGKEFTLFDRETKDHVIPISKGGDNIKENIVPACRSCNCKKHNKILNFNGGKKNE